MRIRHLVVAGLLVAGPAYAADHVMRVDEVMIDGGAGEQYIELHDTSAESLPSTPYTLKIYDTTGTMTETVTLTGLTAGPSVYYLVGNAAADTTYSTATFNATLTMALPNPGQACFERATNAKVHCVAWGCPATVVAGTAATTQSAEVPSSGMSLSRATAGGILQVAIATPGAANSAGTASTSCGAPISDASVSDGNNGTTPDAGNPNNPDAGTDPGGNGDDSGCCQSSSPTNAAGGAVLSLFVLGVLVRRRRRA
jgi:uncharacterized protein (TIGR03382 family)